MASNARFSLNTAPQAINKFYQTNGYVVMENAFSPVEVQALIEETTRICRRQSLVEGAEPLPESLSDDVVLQRFPYIDFPHTLSERMRSTLFNGSTIKVLTSVIGQNVKCTRSKLFIKPSEQAGQTWQQDKNDFPSHDRALTGAWIALDRATIDNGCLWVIPGSHKPGILWDREQLAARPALEHPGNGANFPYTDKDAVAVEVEAGSVIFFNGYLLHRSPTNPGAEGRYRRALVNHFTSCEGHHWLHFREHAPDSEAEDRDVVVVAGQDPLAEPDL